ncbi:MAG: hypothetical protein OEU54_00320 [Gemmatimonadota bacterium]|nr:hypothetical protein [Gemmatimonadota bacterium]
MALVQCRECGIEVSSEAPTCLRCGVPQPAGVPAPAPIYGLDPDTHLWVYEQLLAGVPKAPIADQLAGTYGLTQSGAREIVQQVEGQALSAVTGTRPPTRPSGGNIAPALLSLWIPGLGQVTQGRPGRGFAMFGASALLWIILLGWVMHITAAVDAARWDPID